MIELVKLAVQGRDVNRLFMLLRGLNLILTSHWQGEQQDRNFSGKNEVYLKAEITEFFGQCDRGEAFANLHIYLGDGGISRLLISWTSGKVTVELTPVSSLKVKANWRAMLSSR